MTLAKGFEVTRGRCVRGPFRVFELCNEPVAGPGDCSQIVSQLFGDMRNLGLLELLLAQSNGCRHVLLAGGSVVTRRNRRARAVRGGQFFQLGIDVVRQRATLTSAIEVLATRQNEKTCQKGLRNSHTGLNRSILALVRIGLWSSLGILLTSACQRSDEPPLPERARAPKAEVPTESSSEVKDAGNPWVKRQLDDLRNRTLKWTPRDEPLQTLTFAGEKLFAVVGKEIVVVDPAGKADPARYPIDGPHQLTPLADGSVLAVGLNSTLRLRPGAKSPDSLNRVLLMPQNRLFGSASDAARFDVLDGFAGQWSAYAFAEKAGVSSLWLPDNGFDVPELKNAHCAQQLDGGYACFAGDQLWHMYSRSRPKLLGHCGVGLPVWRVLGAARADQLWVARNDGQLEKWWFGPPLKRLSVIQLPWTPLDVSMNKDSLAEIRIIQDRAKPKSRSVSSSWTLRGRAASSDHCCRISRMIRIQSNRNCAKPKLSFTPNARG